MRRQVVEIFEEWIDFWIEHLKNLPTEIYPCKRPSGGETLRTWLEIHYPDITPETARAVADCFANKPDAYASWETGAGNTINVIIHPIKKH